LGCSLFTDPVMFLEKFLPFFGQTNWIFFLKKVVFYSVNSTNFAKFLRQIFFHKQTPDHNWCYIFRKLKVKWYIIYI
jgi:hypothetical protein